MVGVMNDTRRCDMTLVKILGIQMFSDLLSPQYRERRFDLDKLASAARRAGNSGLAELLGRLAGDMEGDRGVARVVARIGASLAPAC
jgi:hypothetical protein